MPCPSTSRWRLVGVFMLLGSAPLTAADRPSSGSETPRFAPLDDAVQSFMDTIDCQAATVAVSRESSLLHSRGFGWLDEKKKMPVPPDALFRIASVSKAVTAAAVRAEARAGRLDLDDKAFDYLDEKLRGVELADERIKQVTIRQLLKHQGGWDADETFDPLFRAAQIEEELKLRAAVKPQDVARYMLARPLQFTPGEKTAYSNFGYCLLGRVLEGAAKKPFAQCLEDDLFAPLGIRDIRPGRSNAVQRDSREPWYPIEEDSYSVEAMDSCGGLIASAPDLCAYLDHYWLSGEPRRRGEYGNWQFSGSLPGTTSLVRQRTDGLNLVVLFNGRRDERYEEDGELLTEAVNKALDGLDDGD